MTSVVRCQVFYQIKNNNNGGLLGVVASIFLLNALDGMLTLAWVGSGRATEFNPLMDRLLTIHPVLFMAIKMLLVCLGVLLLWRFRDRTAAVASLYLCLAAYSLILVYHSTGLFL
jgi:hypothetical protein